MQLRKSKLTRTKAPPYFLEKSCTYCIPQPVVHTFLTPVYMILAVLLTFEFVDIMVNTANPTRFSMDGGMHGSIQIIYKRL